MSADQQNSDPGDTMSDERDLEHDAFITGTEQPSDTHNKDDRRGTSKLVLMGSIILSLFIGLLNIITLCYIFTEDNTITRDSKLCVNCSHVTLHDDDDLTMFDVYENNVCCVKHGGNYSSMVDKVSNLFLILPDHRHHRCRHFVI